MRSMKASRSRSILFKIICILWFLIPFVIGMINYCRFYNVFSSGGINIGLFLRSIYASLKLYVNTTEESASLPIGIDFEIARLIAMTFSLSILVKAINKFINFSNYFKLLCPKSTVVYGDSVYAEYIYNSLPSYKRIKGNDRFIAHAYRYIIMYSDDKDNLRFYSENYKKLCSRKVYIMLDNVAKQNIEDTNVSIFSSSENSARQLWLDNFPVKSEKIAIIDFSNVGESVLKYGLLLNIIDPKQLFEYHIFGESSSFRNNHTEMDKMLPDKIIFHDEKVLSIESIPDFDRIIICGSEDENISVLSNIIENSPVLPDIYVYSPNGDIISSLFGTDKIHCFGTAEKIATIDMLINEKSHETAKKQHASYVAQNGGVTWEKLDSFKKYSNISSADYMNVILRLNQNGVPLETLAELEHIRWCRYYYFNNWKYGEVRDDSRRLHNCLMPFDKLSDEEKQKDIDAINSKL